MKTYLVRAHWQRVRQDRPCPVCGKTDWCSISADNSAAICMRVQAGSVKSTRNGGFLHRLKGKTNFLPNYRWTIPTVPREGFSELSGQFQRTIKPAQLRELSLALSLSENSLRQLEVGWAAQYGAYSFPMRDGTGNVRGIRLRRPSGAKFAVPGSREGLFIPSELRNALIDSAISSELVITEGPTDCAALLDLGFRTIGRPSCTGGIRPLMDISKALHPNRIIILADSDEPGQRGANSLASLLRIYVSDIRIITPPKGIKDGRAWKMSGATTKDIRAAIDRASRLQIRISAQLRGAKGAENV